MHASADGLLHLPFTEHTDNTSVFHKPTSAFNISQIGAVPNNSSESLSATKKDKVFS